MSTVLVTGGTGFVGSHVILQLLKERHEVRTTIRKANREAGVRSMLGEAGQDAGLRFFEADLMEDRNWDQAVAGCDYVLHVASPFPSVAPANEEDVIAPARDGTLRVLQASRDAGIKRVVLTSSFGAVGYGHAQRDRVFTEEDWTRIEGPDVSPYIKSKTIAERAAWAFVESEGGDMEMTVINPVGIFGPVLGDDISSSITIIKGLLDGMPAVPRIYFGMVDVRDLAELHIRAMQSAVAGGQRFIAIGGDIVSLHDVARMLRDHLGTSASRVPSRQFPDWLLRVLAPFNPKARATLPQLGVKRRSTSEKARNLLGWEPRPYEQTIADTADSLISHGIVRL